MKYFTMSLLVVALNAATCHATMMMPYQNLDRYIEFAEQILVVKCVGRSPGPHEDGIGYKVEVLQSLKGKTDHRKITVIGVFNKMDAGKYYLVFGFGKQFGRETSLVDNGQISPMPIPKHFDVRSLTAGNTKSQVLRLFDVRLKHVVKLLADLEMEKAMLDITLLERN